MAQVKVRNFQPKASATMVLKQASAKLASRLRTVAKAFNGLAPPAPSTSTSSPFLTL